MNIDASLLDKLQNLRKELHQNPELSGKEIQTPARVESFISQYSPSEIIHNVGKTGIAFVFKGKSKGPVVVLRADLDALPIHEVNDFEYRSISNNVGHKCGHDGHMAMVAGVAAMLKKFPIEKGKVVLLFQPAEEIGQGASWVVEDKKFKDLEPDYVLGLHNLPGFPARSIVLNKKTFAAASTGLVVRLTGKTAHAAEPENGNSPVIAMANMMKELTYLPKEYQFKDLVIVTVIHSKLGEIAFGTTPGYGEVMATLRSYRNDDMEKLKQKALGIASRHAEGFNLKMETEWVEEFPATINNEECAAILEATAKENNLEVICKEEPFKWSEDFGHYLMRYKGAFFGIGSGKNTPQLHNPDYDFPDEIIPAGVAMYNGLIRKIMG